MRITISGPPGSGKTTVCKLLAERLGCEFVVSGSFFRDMATRSGLSLAEFGALAESDPKYDKMIDDAMVEAAEAKQNVILEGRLAAHNLSRRGIAAFKVYLDAPVRVRAARIVEREKGDVETALREMRAREECEAARYLRWYGIDIRDMGVYDLVVDTSERTPQGIVDLILEEMGGS